MKTVAVINMKGGTGPERIGVIAGEHLTDVARELVRMMFREADEDDEAARARGGFCTAGVRAGDRPGRAARMRRARIAESVSDPYWAAQNGRNRPLWWRRGGEIRAIRAEKAAPARPPASAAGRPTAAVRPRSSPPTGRSSPSHGLSRSSTASIHAASSPACPGRRPFRLVAWSGWSGWATVDGRCRALRMVGCPRRPCRPPTPSPGAQRRPLTRPLGRAGSGQASPRGRAAKGAPCLLRIGGEAPRYSTGESHPPTAAERTACRALPRTFPAAPNARARLFPG